MKLAKWKLEWLILDEDAEDKKKLSNRKWFSVLKKPKLVIRLVINEWEYDKTY